MKRQTLSLLALSAAAIGSIATSQPVPSWSIDGQAAGPALVLVAGTAGTVSHTITSVVSTEAMDDDVTEGSVDLSAQACFTAVAGTAGTVQPPRLRIILLEDGSDAAGSVLEQPLPLCPSQIGFALDADIVGPGPCEPNLPCTLRHVATFERLGEAEEVRVDWSVSATIVDYGQESPPEGAAVTVTVE